jgi:hypothetical protein
MRRGFIGVLLFALGVLLWNSTTAAAQGGPTVNRSLALRLDEKARRASTTGNENDIRDAVDEAISSSVLDDSDLAPVVKERVANAEIRFRKGQQKAIAEKAVVSTINSLADQFNSPAHAKTSIEQVRMLRMALMANSPHVIGTLPEENGHISSVMSPLEAAFVTLNLIHQKLYNPAFQVTPEEWHQQRYAAKLDRPTPPQSTSAVQLRARGPSEKALALRQTLSNATSGHSRAELEQVLRKAMSDAGFQEVQP